MDASVDGINEWSRKQDFTCTRIRQASRRLGFINTDRVSLNHGIEEPESGAHGCFAGFSDDFTQQAAVLAWGISDTDTRCELVGLRDERRGNSFVRYIHETGRGSGIDLRLLAERKCRNLPVLFRPVLHQVPAYAVVERQIGFDSPAILYISRHILMPGVVGLGARLFKVAGNSEQKSA